MANNIIKQHQLAAAPRETDHGVSLEKTVDYDKYTGSAAALIAAGLITADQLPGQAEGPKLAATYYAGVLCPARSFTRKDEHYLHIAKAAKGKKLCVIVGLSKAAKQERIFIQEATKQAKQQAKRQAECRLFGKRLAYWIAEHGIADKTGARAQIFGLELCAEAAEELGELANRIWQIFDTAELSEVTASSVAQAKATADNAFQSFLREQCITAD